MSEIYFNCHHATPPLKKSVREMVACLERHWMSREASAEVASAAILQILSLLGASAIDRFQLFSSSAEAFEHLLFFYYLDHIRLSGKNHLLTLQTQEASSVLALKKMQQLGCHLKVLEVNERGQLTVETLKAAINPRVALLSVNLCDRLTGMIQPIEQIVKVCHEAGVAVHVDVSCAVGKLPIAFQEWGVDFLTLDGSLCFAPRGIAALIVKQSIPFPVAPSSSLHVAAIVALLESLREVIAMMQSVQLETVHLCAELERSIIAQVPTAQALFGRAHRLPNVSTMAFPGVHSEALLFLLEKKNVYATVGGGSCQRLSHLLLSFGIDPLLAHSAMSFALSFQTTAEQVRQAATLIVESVHSLSRLSTHLLEGK